MSTHTATSTRSTRTTTEHKIASLFGLTGDKWMLHAHPLSVWTRFSVVSLLALAIWSRDWLGWYSLVPIALAIAWMVLNPLLFPPPRSTRNWASKGVFGERILFAHTAKAWYIDRMVLLFEDMKHRDPEYAKWEY